MKKRLTDWKIYRTRFLVRAQQLGQALSFTDALGREHRGRIGDYLVESADGTRSITQRLIFEDIYVVMGTGGPSARSVTQEKPPRTRTARVGSQTTIPFKIASA